MGEKEKKKDFTVGLHSRGGFAYKRTVIRL